MEWYKVLNGTGLLLDMIGIVLLFRWSPIDVEKVNDRILGRGTYGWGKDKTDIYEVDKRIARFMKDNLNAMIMSINEQNQENRRKASVAVLIILVGFFLQGASLFI